MQTWAEETFTHPLTRLPNLTTHNNFLKLLYFCSSRPLETFQFDGKSVSIFYPLLFRGYSHHRSRVHTAHVCILVCMCTAGNGQLFLGQWLQQDILDDFWMLLCDGSKELLVLQQSEQMLSPLIPLPQIFRLTTVLNVLLLFISSRHTIQWSLWW